MGGLSMSKVGAQATNVQQITNPRPTGTTGKSPNAGQPSSMRGGEEARQDPDQEAVEEAKKLLREIEQERLDKAQAEIEKAIESDEELNAIRDQILIDQTPEGLRIQVIDKEGRPMFAVGGATMLPTTEKLFQKVGNIIKDLPNEISIRGHTDGRPYPAGATYTNWELSADRANTSRRKLLDAGFPAERINNVVGKADTEHLLPKEPLNDSNRRISMILLKEELTNPDYERKAEALSKGDKRALEPDFDVNTANERPPVPRIGTFKKTPGKVEFP